MDNIESFLNSTYTNIESGINLFPVNMNMIIYNINKKINECDKNSIDYIKLLQLKKLLNIRRYVLPTCNLVNNSDSCYKDAAINLLSSIEPVTKYCFQNAGYKDTNVYLESLMRAVISPSNRWLTNFNTIGSISGLIKTIGQGSSSSLLTTALTMMNIEDDFTFANASQMMDVYKSINHKPRYLILTNTLFHSVDLYLPNYTVAGVIYHSASGDDLNVSKTYSGYDGKEMKFYTDDKGGVYDILFDDKSQLFYTTSDDGKYLLIREHPTRIDFKPHAQVKVPVELVDDVLCVCSNSVYVPVGDAQFYSGNKKYDPRQLFREVYCKKCHKSAQYKLGYFIIGYGCRHKLMIGNERVSDYINRMGFRIDILHAVDKNGNIKYVCNDDIHCYDVTKSKLTYIGDETNCRVGDDGYIQYTNMYKRTTHGGLINITTNNIYQEFETNVYYKVDKSKLFCRVDDGVGNFKDIYNTNKQFKRLSGSYTYIDDMFFVALNFNTYMISDINNVYIYFNEYIFPLTELYKCKENDQYIIYHNDNTNYKFCKNKCVYLDDRICLCDENIFVGEPMHDMWFMINKDDFMFSLNYDKELFYLRLDNENIYYKCEENVYKNLKGIILNSSSFKHISHNIYENTDGISYMKMNRTCIKMNDLRSSAECSEWKTYRSYYCIRNTCFHTVPENGIKNAYGDMIHFNEPLEKIDIMNMIYFNNELKYFQNINFGWLYKDMDMEWRILPADTGGHYVCYFPQYNALFNDLDSDEYRSLTKKCKYIKFNRCFGGRFYKPDVILYVRND